MAITTRYFSTTGAGAADGTTWADRAELFTAGNWSTVITGHDFSTTSLVCRIGPGTYTCSQALTTGVITTDPSMAMPLILHGCDSSGALLAIPEPEWISAQPAWTDTTLPVIATTTSIATLTLAACHAYLVKFTASGRNGAVITTLQTMVWCVVANTTANTAAIAVSGVVRGYGCVLTCSGSSYDTVFSAAATLVNCRVEGVAGSTGTRRGITSAATSFTIDRCTVVNCGGEGVICTSTNTGQNIQITHSVVANNGSTGVKANSTAGQTVSYETHHCMITGNVVGIDGNTNAARWNVSGNRLRDNTTNIQGIGDYPTDLNNYTTDSDDATEYVSPGANGDFRIKNTATIWGQGFGAGDEPAAGGGLLRHPGINGGLSA